MRRRLENLLLRLATLAGMAYGWCAISLWWRRQSPSRRLRLAMEARHYKAKHPGAGELELGQHLARVALTQADKPEQN